MLNLGVIFGKTFDNIPVVSQTSGFTKVAIDVQSSTSP